MRLETAKFTAPSSKHFARHTKAILLYELCVTETTCMAIFGRSPATVTASYTRVAGALMYDAMACLEILLDARERGERVGAEPDAPVIITLRPPSLGASPTPRPMRPAGSYPHVRERPPTEADGRSHTCGSR